MWLFGRISARVRGELVSGKEMWLLGRISTRFRGELMVFKGDVVIG